MLEIRLKKDTSYNKLMIDCGDTNKESKLEMRINLENSAKKKNTSSCGSVFHKMRD